MITISKKQWVMLAIIASMAVVFFAMYQIQMLNKAHSTFANYYAFRGCATLLEKTDTYGTCKLSSGNIIKIVLYQDKWFLDGDLSCGFLCF